MKRKIRLTESDLHKVIKESVNNILTELDLDKFENQKQEYDRMVNTYECEMTYEEIEGIKQSISMIKQLINSLVKNGCNNDKLLNLLNKHIRKIEDIVENK